LTVRAVFQGTASISDRLGLPAVDKRRPQRNGDKAEADQYRGTQNDDSGGDDQRLIFPH
jgi:hypothetical protein